MSINRPLVGPFFSTASLRGRLPFQVPFTLVLRGLGARTVPDRPKESGCIQSADCWLDSRAH